MQFLREKMPVGRIGECLECAEAVGNRASDDRIGPFRGDESLKLLGVTCVAAGLDIEEFISLYAVLFHYVEHLHHHRLDHETVVVVEVEILAVAVLGIAFEPLLVSGEGIFDTVELPLSGDFIEECLHHCGEEEPVGLGRLDDAGGFHLRYESLLSFCAELAPELLRRAKQAVSEEGRVHERLPAVVEVEVVRGLGVDSVGDGFEGKPVIFRPQQTFRTVLRPVLNPRGDSLYESSEGFEVSTLIS